MVQEVSNLGNEPFEFTGALHTYWLVRNAADCTVEGLKGATADYGIGHSFRGADTEARVAVPVSGAKLTENLYADASDVVTLCEGERKLRLTKANIPDWVLWNVGEEKAPGMGDLGEGKETDDEAPPRSLPRHRIRDLSLSLSLSFPPFDFSNCFSGWRCVRGEGMPFNTCPPVRATHRRVEPVRLRGACSRDSGSASSGGCDVDGLSRSRANRGMIASF